MKSSRGVVLVLALLCVGLGYALGRGTAGAGPRPSTWLEQVDQALALRPEQRVALDALLTEEDRRIEELLEEHRRQLAAPLAARLQRIEDVMLAEILDEQQRERYLALLATGTGEH